MTSRFMTSGTMGLADSTEWETPDPLFERYHETWQFTLDAAASPLNAKLPRFLSKDGLYVPFQAWEVLSGPSERVGDKIRLPADMDANTLERGSGFERVGEPEPDLVDSRDGLEYPWEGEVVFLNPPWGDGLDPCNADPMRCTRKICARRGYHINEREPGLPDFIRKVVREHLHHRVPVLVVLPARTDTGWFHDYVKPFAREVEFLRGRTAFLNPETKEPATQPPVGLLIAQFR